MRKEKHIEEIVSKFSAEERRDVFRHLRNADFFHDVFNNIREGIIIFDRALRIEFANFAGREMLGLSEDFKSQKISLYLKGMDWKAFLLRSQKVAENVSRREIEISYPRRKILLFYIVPHDADKGTFVAIFHDVTELSDKRTEKIEEEKNNMVSLLAAGVAHEIGNPLNSIGIHLQLLERKLSEKKKTNKGELELLSISKKEVSRLELIIKGFLQALRIDKPVFSKLDIKRILVESLNFMKPEVENKLINVNCDFANSVPPAKGDENQIKQVFYNIIKNAIQSMPEGGTLDITCDASDESALISFRDSGRGIAPELIDKIFNPYFSTKAGGSGLGLMIVERIIREHSGNISIDSSPEKGTRFTVEIPFFDKKVKLLPVSNDFS
jgi:signal transduction histidine kinase